MRIAIIDCGTNTFNLLVSDTSVGKWDVVFQNKLPVKLGAGGFEEHRILPGRFVRGLDALYCHKENIRNFQCEKVFAFATSAIREASNGGDFVIQARALLGIDIEIIDGNREAELIYEGVHQTVVFDEKPCLIMDIGGGSTEFIVANKEGILWKQSFQLGVSRLNDLVKPEIKFTQTDTDYLQRILTSELEPLVQAIQKNNVTQLIGSSGSFDTLLMLYIHNTKKDPSEVELANNIPLSAFREIHRWLMNSTFEDRLKHSAIPSMRAEYMPLASYLVSFVLQQGKFESLRHSAYSLKEGAMLDIIEHMDWPTPEENEKPEDYLEA